MVLLVEKANHNILAQLAQEFRAQRPSVPPPDPIAFQQQKALFSEE